MKDVRDASVAIAGAIMNWRWLIHMLLTDAGFSRFNACVPHRSANCQTWLQSWSGNLSIWQQDGTAVIDFFGLQFYQTRIVVHHWQTLPIWHPFTQEAA